MAYPKLIVFDLDHTLWPFWVDRNVKAPFRRIGGKIIDANQKILKCYEEAPGVLQKLSLSGVKMAVASRTECTEEAKDLVRLFNWTKYFSYSEIFPGSKVDHFERLHTASGVPYNRMLFFDDEPRNVEDISALGVTCIHVKGGMRLGVLIKGLDTYKATLG